mmetsp:Transcript_57093/g.170156  ORF Transcript_57093/g.170156 Transcript_57093/m.170156 type:complete len:204 (+) Transcript_57093:1476-2087(+)
MGVAPKEKALPPWQPLGDPSTKPQPRRRPPMPTRPSRSAPSRRRSAIAGRSWVPTTPPSPNCYLGSPSSSGGRDRPRRPRGCSSRRRESSERQSRGWGAESPMARRRWMGGKGPPAGFARREACRSLSCCLATFGRKRPTARAGASARTQYCRPTRRRCPPCAQRPPNPGRRVAPARRRAPRRPRYSGGWDRPSWKRVITRGP